MPLNEKETGKGVRDGQKIGSCRKKEKSLKQGSCYFSRRYAGAPDYAMVSILAVYQY